MALAAEYKLSGGVWTDTSGNGYNLTMTGTLSQATGFQGGANTAVSNNATTGRYLTVADPANVSGQANLSIICRFKPASVSAIQVLVGKGVSGSYEFSFYVNASGKLVSYVSTNGTAVTSATGATTLSVGTWYILCMVYDGANINLYVGIDSTGMASADGTAAKTGTIYNGTTALYLCANTNNANFLNGTLDDVRIYNSALTQANREAYCALGEDFTSITNISASVVNLTLTEYPASVESSKNIQAAAAALTLTTYPASVVPIAQIDATKVTLTLTEYPATLTLAAVIPAAVVGMTLTEHAASITNYVVTEEVFSVLIKNGLGAGMTGLTNVLISAIEDSTGYRWDFTDSLFKLTSAIPTLALTEFNASSNPGYYSRTIQTTGWNGNITITISYNIGYSTFRQWVESSVEYASGVRVTHATRTAQTAMTASVSALPTLTATAVVDRVIP